MKLSTTTCALGPLSKGLVTIDTFAGATAHGKLVGKLNYLTNARPNIAFSVQYLSQFLQAPNQSLMIAALYTLRHIKKKSLTGFILQ